MSHEDDDARAFLRLVIAFAIAGYMVAGFALKPSSVPDTFSRAVALDPFDLGLTDEVQSYGRSVRQLLGRVGEEPAP